LRSETLTERRLSRVVQRKVFVEEMKMEQETGWQVKGPVSQVGVSEALFKSCGRDSTVQMVLFRVDVVVQTSNSR
jgi:hypothetical protein